MYKQQEQKLCPYDKRACDKMTRNVQEWKEHIAYLAKNSINMPFYTSGGMFKKCEDRYSCSRFKEHERKRKVLSSMSGLMIGVKSGYVCPHNNQIECDLFYRCDEFFRQNPDYAFGDKEPSCSSDVCPAIPEACPRYAAFINKQKQR